MVMWIVIMVVIIGLAAGLLFYLINRFRKFRFVTYIAGKAKKPWLRTLIALIIVVLLFFVFVLITSTTEAIIILIHAGIFWAIVEGIFALIKVIFKVDFNKTKVYVQGIVAILVTTVYMLVALYLGATVDIANYTVTTDKNVEPLRIVQFADSHLGVTMDIDTFPPEVEKMKAQNPDIVLITGDFVDDGSSLENMHACVDALSTIDCKYGVYFCFGNHDKGYYDNSGRGYTADDLVEYMTSHGIKVLEDETVNLDNEYLLIGRADKSESSRASMQSLVSEIDTTSFADEYSIVMDHQPNDYAAEANAGVDLVLSGHTHGGQFFPINRVGELIGANDATYGYHRIDNTDFIVTSGISAWAIRFKTGTRSEIVVIDVE